MPWSVQLVKAPRQWSRVAIVAKHGETIASLQTYLEGAGLAITARRRLEGFRDISTDTSALVLFPDDFDWGSVTLTVAQCAQRKPRALLVLVTSSPQRFEALPWPADGEPVIVPKPAWASAILDAIRVHLGHAGTPSSNPRRRA